MEIIIIWAICALLCNGIAKAKNLNSTFWGFMGLLFGVFAVIAVLFAKSNKSKADTSESFVQVKIAENNNGESDMQRLSRLKELQDQGVITQEDYDQQKQKIFDSYGSDNSKIGKTTLGATGAAVGFDVAARNAAKNFIQSQANSVEEGEELFDGLSDFLQLDKINTVSF